MISAGDEHAAADQQKPCGTGAVVPAPALSCLSRHRRNLRDYRADCDFLPVAPCRPRRRAPSTMNPDTAELAIVDPAGELAGARCAAPPIGERTTPRRARASRGRGALARCARRIPRATAAVRDSWRALWSSRLLVWAAGVGDAADVRLRAGAPRLQPARADARLRLARRPAGGARRRAGTPSWYLVIAHYGYRPDLGAFTASRDAFFPLYPLGLRGARLAGRAARARAAC